MREREREREREGEQDRERGFCCEGVSEVEGVLTNIFLVGDVLRGWEKRNFMRERPKKIFLLKI